MNLIKRMAILLGLVLTLTVPATGPVLAQTYNANDGTTLRQIIIYGRHSIRSSTNDPSALQQYAIDPYPDFEVDKGLLTPRGRIAESLLGAYFRSYLLKEGVLTGNNEKDAAHSYFRSNSIERSYETAAAFQGALIPDSTQAVHSFPINDFDPVFDPLITHVAQVDPARAVTEVNALYNSGAALASAYSGEYSLIRSVLFDYPLGTQPPPDTPAGLVDVTALPITLTANTPPYYTGAVINVGGLIAAQNALDPFVMQYADGFALDQVAWGRLTLDQLSQETRVADLIANIELRSSYLDQVQSSNAASHILRTMNQAVTGSTLRGAFGNAASKVVVAISSDTYVAGLAGLLNLHWQLPGYQPDFCAPGGALVFELRQVNKTKKLIVRVFYTAQTFDQLRNLRPLTLDQPPATLQLLVPGGSQSAANLDVDYTVFKRLLTNAIDMKYVQNPGKEIQPGVLSLD